MKKVKLLLCMLSLASLGLLTACDDDDGGSGDQDPGSTNAPAALTAGDSMQFTPTDENLGQYTVTFDGVGGYTSDFGETGTYAYQSDGADGATLVLDAAPADGNDPDPFTYNLTFDSTGSGAYSVSEVEESGTLTFSDVE